MKKPITEVQGYKIGDGFWYDGIYYIIISFPTKNTVVGRTVPDKGFPFTCKIPVTTMIFQNKSANVNCPNT